MKLGIKDISDWLKVALITASLFMGYQSLRDRLQVAEKELVTLTATVTRVERYLASQDQSYYEKSAKVEGNNGK
jgi:hypothetical protein